MKKKQVKTLRLLTLFSNAGNPAGNIKRAADVTANVTIKSAKLSFTMMTVVSLLMGTSMALTTNSTVSAAACPYDANLGSTDPNNAVTIPADGSYTIWTRMAAPDATHNKVYLEIDGSTCYTLGGGSFATSTWTSGSENWTKTASGAAISLNLTAGSHKWVYKGLDAGVMVDKIIFTTDTSCTPTGTGTNCQAGDSTPPTVNITSPTNGQSVSGTVAINATANDTGGSGVKDVKFLVDGQVVGTDTTSPYSYSWNASTASNGTHSLTAQATDNNNNSATSAAVSVTVTGGGGGTPKQGDLNGDGKVNITDLSVLLSNWGKSGVPADLNSSGKVDITDLSILLSHWG